MHPERKLALLFLMGLFCFPSQAFSYVGPGLGAGTIGVILGLLGSILLASFAFFWYPIKRAFFSKEDEKEEDDEPTPIESDAPVIDPGRESSNQ
jgi:hypothetical protein